MKRTREEIGTLHQTIASLRVGGGGGGGEGVWRGEGGERVTIQSQSDVGGMGDVCKAHGQASQLVVTVIDSSLTPVSLE